MGVLSKGPSLSQPIQSKDALTRHPRAAFDKLVLVITRTPLARAAASVILAGALVVGTAGCTFVSRQATLIQYDPSDGVGANLGSVQIRNAIGLIDDEGDVSLVVAIVNSGTQSAKVALQFESNGDKTTVTKTVAAGKTASFGHFEGEDQIVILNPGVPAGGLLPVYVQYGDNPGVQMLVPVLDPVGDYEGLGPVVATPTPTPTPTPAVEPAPAETPAP